MRRNLLILISLSLATFSLVSVVVCEENLPVKITDLGVYVKSPSIKYVDFLSISDDGSKIAFVSISDYVDELFVINSDGSGLQQLTDKKFAFGATYSSISGDGSKIIVRSAIDKGSEHGLFVVNSDGSEWHQLEPNKIRWPNGIKPWSLSRDGSKIVIVVQENNDLPGIFVVDSDISSTELDPVIEYLVILVLAVVAIAVLIVIVLRRKKLQAS